MNTGGRGRCEVDNFSVGCREKDSNKERNEEEGSLVSQPHLKVGCEVKVGVDRLGARSDPWPLGLCRTHRLAMI